MIDIHSHILCNVDDGATSMDNSLEILKKAEQAGFTDIILTPHYIEGYYENTKQKISEKIRELKQAIYSENIVVSLHGGNEILLTENSPELVQAGIINTLSNSRYVLFEVPFTTKMLNLEEIIYSFIDKGYIPILAHPERFSFIQENPESLIKLLKIGMLAQSNYGSFIGFYGKEVKSTAEILLKNRLIQFLGSDTHRQGQIYENINKIINKLEVVVGDKKYVNELTTLNPKSILDDFEIQTQIPNEIKDKKRIFSFL